LLDIYPKTNGTVSVTYGGLTKTITDTSGAGLPNAQQVFFGTFNGVSDDIKTPESGELTIEGDCREFGCGSYKESSKDLVDIKCSCIVSVVGFGNVKSFPNGAFYGCTKLTSIVIPYGVTLVGSFIMDSGIFYGCTSLSSVVFPNSVTLIGANAFNGCINLSLSSLPIKLATICGSAFKNCIAITNLTIPESVNTIEAAAFSTPDVVVERTFTMLSTIPPELEADDVFLPFDKTKIVVPKGCAEAYKSAENWSAFADIIVEASE
jgi:hypothetical protein